MSTGNTEHVHLLRHHEKKGACCKCGLEGRTDFAFLRHPEPHTRDRQDYAELCRACHAEFDALMRRRRYHWPLPA